LTVERSCSDAAKPSEELSQPAATPSQTASATPEETAPSEPEAAATLTPQNNKELKAMLGGDDCDDKYAAFAKKYPGKTIEFNGSIADVANHGDYKTRFDFLISPGDKGSLSTRGPSFKFADVNRFDLHFIGPNIPDGVSRDDKFHFVAEVLNYNSDNCLFFLRPVSTQAR
jgi:hypothetical protein